jgi:hypothetical protein
MTTPRRTHFDRFRHRIMIPIRDENGRMAGFGARIVDPDDIPKFLNSPETPIFSKGRLLYGLDRARKPIRAVDQAVIVEGYLDVIALHQAGYENVVSPMGVARRPVAFARSSRKIVLARTRILPVKKPCCADSKPHVPPWTARVNSDSMHAVCSATRHDYKPTCASRPCLMISTPMRSWRVIKMSGSA